MEFCLNPPVTFTVETEWERRQDFFLFSGSFEVKLPHTIT